jgi:hypothetical protein
MSNKKNKNTKSIKPKRGKRRNKTRKQKGGACPCSGKSLFYGGGNCAVPLVSGGNCAVPLVSGGNCAVPLVSGGKCKKCNAFFLGGGNANLDNVFNNPNYVIPVNNFMNDPNSIMKSERLTVGGKKSRRRRLQKKRGGLSFTSLVPMDGVTAFGDSGGISTMKNILSGNVNSNYQPYGSNLTLPSHNVMV